MTLNWKNTGWGLQSWPDKRFVITKTTDGYNVVDREQGTITRTHTVQGAKAVAGIRVGETVVHQWENKLYA